MVGAWVVQQHTGNSGWVDTIWTFSLGLLGAGSALWPVAGASPLRGNGWSRCARAASAIAIQSRTSRFFPLPPHA
jgi:steroid 5-alpha reductase family enzyme